MKICYTSPEIEVVVFNAADVITASAVENNDNEFNFDDLG